MTDILIIGGHGKIALQAARLLAERGDRVTSVIRKPEQQDDVAATGATLVAALALGLMRPARRPGAGDAGQGRRGVVRWRRWR